MRGALALTALLAVAVAAGCGSSGRHAGTASAPTAPGGTTTSLETSSGSQVVVKLPRVLKQSFLASCSKSGKASERALCSCTLVRLSRAATQNEIAVLSQAGRTRPVRTQRKLTAATKACEQTR